MGRAMTKKHRKNLIIYQIGKGGRVFRNNYKGHMDKTKGGWKQGREVGMAGVGGSCGG